MTNPLTAEAVAISSCKICDGAAHYFDVVDFNKYCSRQNSYQFGLIGEPVYFLRCEACGFIFTEHCDKWTAADFSQRIYNDDYVLVDGEYSRIRPGKEAERFVESVSAGRGISVLDFGSGTGIFAEKLKSFGYSDVESFDPFSSPVRPPGLFDVVTAIEVLEHSPSPRQTLREILSFAKPDCAIIFTTLIQPADVSSIRGQHWYVAPRNGHVSFYSRASLCDLSARFGLSYHMHRSYHVFVRGTAPILIDSSPVQCVRLTAPSVDSGSQVWNGVEEAAVSPRRWTASSTIEWRLSNSEPARAFLTIPFITEIIPGFAGRCFFFAGGVPADTTAVRAEKGYELRACVDLPGNNSLVALKTPEPVRPSDLNLNSDSRQLGLLIPC